MTDPIDHPRNTVLVVDDEPEIRRMATAVLSMGGFKAQVAEDGRDGLGCFLKHQHEICLVVSDVVMPRMNGLEMVDCILELDPKVKILMMSAYSSAVLEVEARAHFPFIRKPFLAQDFIRKIRDLLGIGLGAADASAACG
jgi:DNA-binding NtrC family response regulator